MHNVIYFMDNLTSVCNFFENSSKWQKYFACFVVEFCKVYLKLPKAERNHRIIMG